MANTLRFLLIHPDPGQSEQICSRLFNANFSVITASGLDEASEVLDIQRFDAVLFAGSANGNGIESFAAKLHALDMSQRSFGPTPILCLSAEQEKSGPFRADAYLPPDFEPAALANAVTSLARAVSNGIHQAAPAPLPVFDFEKLNAQAANDPELIVEIVGLFLSDYGDQVAQMRDALQAGDYDRLSACAHTIKGSLGTLGGMSCWSLAQRLELAARNRDERSCRELFPLFEDGLRALVPHLQSLL